MNWSAALAILFVFIGCCSNVIFLELLVKEEPASGHIITCFQFLFIVFQGFLFTMNCGRKKNIIPVKEYMVLVVLFFIVNTTNNMAFGFKISMPLHIIFRSGGLIASMLMGMVVLGRRYTFTKYVSVLLITFGTILCTLASSGHIDDAKTKEEAEHSFTTWLTGIGILTFALFLSARMGIFQECLYTKYGKHHRESLFYIHLLALPGFLITGKSIYEHALIFNESTPLEQFAAVPFLASVPKLWLYIMGNTLTQFVCISSVFALTSECTALTVTLVLTLRKFMSLIFSILYFRNEFTNLHWMGTMMVFGGTLVFAEVFTKVFTKTKIEHKKAE